jgi:pSer/pThr/pTyr-binding forkhead associated (FHA) protein
VQSATAFKLVIEDDDGSRSVVPCDLGEVSIGRYEDNTIRLDERNVSRHHARLLKSSDGVFAEDLDSYNGVWVNGERIDGRRELLAGDIIRIGDFALELRGDELKEQREEITARTPVPGLNEATEPSITQVDIRPPGIEFDEGLTDPQLESSVEPSGQIVEKTAIIRSEDYPGLADEDVKAQVIAGQKARLLVVSTINAGQEIMISKTALTIGRTDGDNDVALEHRSISRNHAKILLKNDVYQLQDLESANGVAVNGEPYVQCDLKSGDLVELGHVKLRFIGPGQMYTPTEEEVEAISTARPGALHRSGGSQAQVESGLRALLGQRSVQIGLAGSLLILCLAMGGLVLWGSGSKDSANEATTIVSVQSKAKSDQAETGTKVSWMTKARDALKTAAWSKALAYANMGLSEGASAEEAQLIIEEANKEKGIQANYESALQSVEQGQWQEAWTRLQEIPEDSYYSAQATALREQMKETLIEDLAARAREKLAIKDWNEARALAEKINEIAPESSYLSEIRGVIEKEKLRREEAAQKSKVKSKETSSKTSAAKAPKKKPSGTTKAVATPSSADLREIAKKHYAEGTKLYGAKRHREALRRYSACVKADKTYYPCYIGLGNSYGALSEHEQTARYYKLYVKYAPEGASKAQVVQWLRNYESR